MDDILPQGDEEQEEEFSDAAPPDAETPNETLLSQEDADSDAGSSEPVPAVPAFDPFGDTFRRFGLKASISNVALAHGVVATKKGIRLSKEHFGLALSVMGAGQAVNVSRGGAQASKIDEHTVRLSVPEASGGSLRLHVAIPDYFDVEAEIED